MKISICETCKKEFQRKQKQKFCSKKCLGYENLKRIKFDWNDLSEEEKKERLRKSFECKVIKKDGCWDWKGALSGGGYFQIRFNKKKVSAHRISWIIHKGQIPENLWVLHKCDNPRCTNPDHLFLGTPKENSKDRDRKGKGQQGEKHHKAKLKENDVLEIRKKLDLGLSCERISKEYGVSNGAIWFIKHNLTWNKVK